jgi:pheromone shutdown protein TraB
MFEELGRELPGVIEPLIHERDRFLSYQLRRCCSMLADQPLPKIVVAVVGMGHVKGIRHHFALPVDLEDMERISQLPATQPRYWTPARITLVTSVVGIAAWAVYRYTRK